MITFQLSPDEEMFAKTARDFAEQRLRTQARTAEKLGRVPDEIAGEYLALGFGAVEIPEAYGGLGQGIAGRAIVESLLAFGDAAMAAGMPWIGPGARALLMLGSDAQKQLLARCVENGSRIAIAWSEPRPDAMTLARQREDGSFAITGRKVEVELADRARAIVVFARAILRDGSEQPAAFVVETEDRSRLRIGDPEPPQLGLGMMAAPCTSVTIEDRIVPADQMMAAPDPSVERMFLHLGVVTAAREVGLGRAAFEYARDYAEQRIAFGKPIAHFQGLAFLLADMATRVEVMDGLVKRAAWSIDRQAERAASEASGDGCEGSARAGPDDRMTEDADRLASHAIEECHEGAIWLASQAVQVLGGAGFVTDHPVEKWMRDAQAIRQRKERV